MVDYPPEYLMELKAKDPKAYEFLLRFIEAEYGCKPKLFYKKKKDIRRCWAQDKTRQLDAMNDAVQDAAIDMMGDTDQASTVEDRLNAAIDNRHILKGLDRCAMAEPKEYDAAFRQAKKLATDPKPASPIRKRRGTAQ